MKVILLGGYGTFGTRLAERLIEHADIHLLIAGRTLSKAAVFCERLSGPAKLEPFEVTRQSLCDTLSKGQADLVIDATGPFQDYGPSGYDLIKACIKAHINYLDFADGAEFVNGVVQFDEQAKTAGIYVISGASSFPTLTAAVIAEFSKTMDVETVIGGAAPSPRAIVGLNVIRAVLGYAGQPIQYLRDGQPSSGIGLLETKRYIIATPGQRSLRSRRFALVDVPDLQIIPQYYPKLKSIWMGASINPPLINYAITLVAWLRSKRVLPNLDRFSNLFFKISNILRIGENRGGMFVRVTGTKSGQPNQASWHLTAEGDNGPYIPTMASEILTLKHLRGQPPKIGARAAVEDLVLSDFDATFADRDITHGFRPALLSEAPLFKTVLADKYKSLPKPVQELHNVQSKTNWTGRATVERGKNPIGNLVGWLFGFPKAGTDLHARVTIEKTDTGETWNRYIGSGHFRSHLSIGVDKSAHHINERFGPFTVQLAMIINEDRLYFTPQKWRIGPIPLPRIFLPQGDSFETSSNGRFQFDVTIQARFIGLIAHYKGWLECED